MQNELKMILNFNSFEYQEILVDYYEMVYMSNVIIENNLDLLFLKLATNKEIYYLDKELQIEWELINNKTCYKLLSGKKKIISKIKQKNANNRINFIIVPLLIIESKTQEFNQIFLIFDKNKKIIFKYGKFLKIDKDIDNIILNLIMNHFIEFEYQILFDIEQDKVLTLHNVLNYFFDNKYLDTNNTDCSFFLKTCYDYVFNELWFENFNRINYHRLIYNSNNVNLQLKTLKKLLKQSNPDLINLSVDGLTCLELSCKMGLYDFSKILIEYGANFNTRSEYGLNSPLHLAIKFNKNLNSQYNQIIKYLIEKHVDVNTYDETLTTPLFTAAAKNDLNTFNLLIENGAIITTKTITNKNIIHYICSTPEFFTIDKLNYDILNKIINKGIKIEDVDINNSNTLHLACKYLNSELVDWIIEISNKLDINLINKKDCTGKTPLQIVKEIIIDYDSYLDNSDILASKDFAKINSNDDKKTIELKIINYFLIQQKLIINTLENLI
jgi:hypothetical protein